MTAEPGGKGDHAGTPDLDAVGDNHMPEDLRRAERERSRQAQDRGEDPTEEAGEDPGDQD